jgi:hypothetical protein
MIDPERTSQGPTKTLLAGATILVFVATLLSLDAFGKGRRQFSPGREVLVVERPIQVYELWKARGVRGRTLVLFGPFPHLWRTSYVEGAAPAGEQSFVERAARDNLVRRVYFLVPDEDWDKLFGRDLPGFFRRVPGLDRGLYMHYSLGLPIVATTPSSLPTLGEPALVYVDTTRFELPFVERVLSRKGIRADLILTSAGM